jgi:hypothetical protein
MELDVNENMEEIVTHGAVRGQFLWMLDQVDQIKRIRTMDTHTHTHRDRTVLCAVNSAVNFWFHKRLGVH